MYYPSETIVGVRVCVRGLRTHFAQRAAGSERIRTRLSLSVDTQTELAKPLLSRLAMMLAVFFDLLGGSSIGALLRSLLTLHAIGVTALSAVTGILYEAFRVAWRLLTPEIRVQALAYGMVLSGFSPSTDPKGKMVRIGPGNCLAIALGVSALNRRLLGRGGGVGDKGEVAARPSARRGAGWGMSAARPAAAGESAGF